MSSSCDLLVAYRMVLAGLLVAMAERKAAGGAEKWREESDDGLAKMVEAITPAQTRPTQVWLAAARQSGRTRPTPVR